MIDQTIQSLFKLRKKDAGVYRACLELGSATVSDISKKSKVERTHCYSILEKLVLSGLVIETERHTKKIYSAEDPEKTFHELKNQIQKFEESLPELKSIYNLLEGKPKVRFYEGKDEIIALHRKILESGEHEMLFCGSLDDLNKIITKKWCDEYWILMRVKKKIRLRMLTFDTPANRAYKKDDRYFLRETRFLNDSYFFDSTFYIYGHTVTICSGSDETIGFEIESKAISVMFTRFFEIMWTSVQ
jgi:sugar-specific transcriptional regulator TrmB